MHGTPQPPKRHRAGSEPIINNFGFCEPLGTSGHHHLDDRGDDVAHLDGELITQYGIGNGISMIIFGGLLPVCRQLYQAMGGTAFVAVAIFVILGLITVAAIVMIYEGSDGFLSRWAKRIRGSRIMGGQSTHIP